MPKPEIASFHHVPVPAVLERFSASRAGLGAAEAAERLARWGPNRLPELKGKTLPGVFLSQFKSPFIYLLLAAGLVSLSLGHIADTVFISTVLLLNAAIGTYQEWRAETRARSLKALIKASVAVWRDGRLERLPSEGLVPGDIVQVESGEKIAADLRLIEALNLSVDESLLTGESLPVRKDSGASVAADAPLSEHVTMLHAGTTVQAGRGVGLVVTTAQNTTVGKLAAALDTPEPEVPLVRRMARFTRHVAIAVMGVILLIAVLELLRGAGVADIFLLAVALAVSAIPEGLPVAMTVALSIAMHRMGLRHVVVRHLPAVEGLGACTLIATDKTGTLTLNRLSVQRIWLPGRGNSLPTDAAAREMLVAAMHASEQPAGTGDSASGDAVDLAFFACVRANGWCAEPANVAARMPYEPEKRLAATFHDNGGSLVAYVKGAPETVFALCSDVDADALAAAEKLSGDGYRVIAVAAGRVALSAETSLQGLHLLGLAGLIDPLRPEAKGAIAKAQDAGIRVIMITGDHPLTALAIARELGLAQERDEVVVGAELSRLRGAAFDTAVQHARVFGRTEPMQKLTIVESLRRQGHVVAVTGDGINDAAALHAADIGVAMGKGGTDVARDAADLILTDDNFASIVAGIEEGRIAYDNLRKVIMLLTATGAAEILVMLLATLTGLPPPLTAVQLLWLNLVTNGMQDVALAFEKGEPGVLRRKPRPAHAPIFDRRMIEQVVLGGLVIGLAAFLYYNAALAAGISQDAAQGGVLWLLVWAENAYVLSCRSETRPAFAIPLRDNPLLIGALVGTQLLQVSVLAVPSLRELLSMQEMTIVDGLSLAIAGLSVLLITELYKRIRRPREGREAEASGSP